MENNVQNKFHIALKSLKIIGYFESQFYSKLYGTLFLSFGCLIIFGELVGFVNRTTTQERLETVYFTCGAMFMFFFYLAVKSHQKRLRKCLSIIFEYHSTNDDMRLEVLQVTIKKADRVIPRLTIVMAFLLVPIPIAWCFTPLMNDFDHRNKNFDIIPYLFRCMDNGENRFPLKFLCTRRETFLHFILINLVASIYSTWGFAAFMAWQFLFLVCFCIFIKANITVLKRRLQYTVDNSRHSKLSRYNDTQAEENEYKTKMNYNQQRHLALKSQFNKVIEYHQYLHR